MVTKLIPALFTTKDNIIREILITLSYDLIEKYPIQLLSVLEIIHFKNQIKKRLVKCFSSEMKSCIRVF